MQTSHVKCHITVKISLTECYLRCTPCACLTFQETQGEKQNTLFLRELVTCFDETISCCSYFSKAGLFSKCPRMAFLIMVFLPMRISALPRRDWRICCICLDPTLSTPTRNILGNSSIYCCWEKCIYNNY